ncbi:MAG TPA: winged helix-turn-helix domain-containing protein [Terriglobales bacterium]|nr:winged helix-turn-helix domain-containing protein [Terriglobales bacterium]
METAQETAGVVRFGVFDLDLRAAELRKHGIRIKLQEQPFQILSLLIERQGDVVTRDELRHRLWPEHTFVDFDRSLNKAMTKLRSALGDSAENPRYIETLYRRGYRLLAPVTMQAEHARVTGAEPHGTQFESRVYFSETGQRSVSKRSPRRIRILKWAVFAGIFLILGSLLYARYFHWVTLGNSSSQVIPIRSVAVLGFQNLSQDPHEAWLSTALSEWLTTELATGGQLRTIPAESVARMKIELSLPDVGVLEPGSLERVRKDLGTDLVVAGSYAALDDKSGDQIRLDVRLQDTRTDETLDALSETGTESNLFDLVSKAGQNLRSKLGVRAVTREEEAAVEVELPANPEAARLYSEGIERLRDFDSLAARNLLQQAISAEPNFALSHAALAGAWEHLGYDEYAKQEAEKAFNLSSKLSRVDRLLVEGRYREASLDWGKAIEIYRALFEFFPDNLDYGLALADAQVSGEKGPDALATTQLLRQLPAPLRDDPRIDMEEGLAAESQGDYRKSLQCSTRAVEKARATGASLLLAHALLSQAWASENLGDFDKVAPAVSEAKEIAIAAHDQGLAASATTIEAIALEMEGDFSGAKEGYEQSLALDQKIGNLKAVAAELDNLGDAFFYLGDLPSARKSYEDSAATYRKIGHQDGIGLADSGLGDVLLAMGSPEEATRDYTQALQICRQLGDRSKAAGALLGLGRTQRVQGKLLEAAQTITEAKSDYQQIGDTLNIARAELTLAQLDLDTNKTSEALNSAQNAAASFEKLHSFSDAGNAYLLLSEVFLAQRNVPEAKRMIGQALKAVGSSHQRELSLLAAIGAARVQAASGATNDVVGASKQLATTLEEANRAGFAVVALEARLALGELKFNNRDHSDGIADLRRLQRDASQAGLLLIGHKAAEAAQMGLAEAVPQSTLH